MRLIDPPNLLTLFLGLKLFINCREWKLNWL
jgi:hypothetical protein